MIYLLRKAIHESCKNSSGRPVEIRLHPEHLGALIIEIGDDNFRLDALHRKNQFEGIPIKTDFFYERASLLSSHNEIEYV